jgi:hypothetical protein
MMRIIGKFKMVDMNKFYRYNKIHERSFIGIKLLDK